MFLFSEKKYFNLFLFNIILLIGTLIFINHYVNKISLENEKEIRLSTIENLKMINNDENFNLILSGNQEAVDEFLKIKYTPSYNKNIYIYKIIIFISMFFLISIIHIILYFIMNYKQKKYVQSVDKFIKSIIDKDFNIVLREKDESIISKLNSRFNKLGLAVRNNYDNLNIEKLNLKTVIADISHQIKTPLSALSMYNEILLDSDNLNENQISFLKLSISQIKRLEWLISSMLKISRFEANVIDMNYSEFEIGKLTENIEKSLIKNLTKNNLKIIQKGDLQETVSLDLKWTREALLNIVKNATEHALKNTNILIEYTVNITMIRIDISNKGNNISNKDIINIFKRFYKSENNTNPESVGIGLNLSKNIIEKQFGTLYVQNTNDGVTFTVLFLK